MIKFFTEHGFELAKSRDFLLLKCEFCDNLFKKSKNTIQKIIKGNKKWINGGRYCSRSCHFNGMKNRIYLNCGECDKPISITPGRIKKNVHGKYFCNRLCANKHNLKFRVGKNGIHRSRFESWLENKLNDLYPDINILYNDKEAIKSELDIYIPELKLAIEINGPWHYKKMSFVSQKHFNLVKRNDAIKKNCCRINNIDLKIMDVSNLPSQIIGKKANILRENLLLNVIRWIDNSRFVNNIGR